jgi:hypothetical protein
MCPLVHHLLNSKGHSIAIQDLPGLPGYIQVQALSQGISFLIIDVLQHSKLRSLHLATTILDGDDSMTGDIQFLARYAVVKISTLVHLTVDIPIDAAKWEKIERRWKLDFRSPIKEINNALGVSHKWVESSGRHAIGVRWEAGINGVGTLTWTDEDYWKSIKRHSIGLVYSRLTGCERVNFRNRHLYLGFNRQACLDCPNRSCHWHARAAEHGPIGTRSHEAEGSDEDYWVDATLLDPVATARAVMRRRRRP